MDFKRYNAGSAVQSFNRNHIQLIPINVPPIEEQRAIASILGALDDKIELNRRMNATLDSGSAIPSTSRDDFYAIPVCLPPTDVLTRFGKILEPWKSQHYANERESLTLSTLRDTLLPRLLSGELPVPAALTSAKESLANG